jgi:hypothetical protein
MFLPLFCGVTGKKAENISVSVLEQDIFDGNFLGFVGMV